MEPEPLVDPHAKDTDALFNPAEAVPEVGADGEVIIVNTLSGVCAEYPPITVYCLKFNVTEFMFAGTVIVPLPLTVLNVPDKIVQVVPASMLYSTLVTVPVPLVAPKLYDIVASVLLVGVINVTVGLSGVIVVVSILSNVVLVIPD